jgi:hypothetical protein
MKHPKTLGTLFVLYIFVLFVASSCNRVSANTLYVWDGGGTNNKFDTCNNWVSNCAPPTCFTTTATDIRISGNTRTSPDVNQDWEWNDVDFCGATTSFDLGSSGANRIVTLKTDGDSCDTPSITQNSTSTQTISIAHLDLTTDLEINVSCGDLIISGDIRDSGGARSVNLIGSNTLTLSDTDNSFSGGITIGGSSTLKLGASNVIPDTGGIIFDGGTLDTNNFDETVGALTLQSNSTISLGTSNTLTLADSSGTTWTVGTTLTISGWSGSAGSSGTGSQIFLPDTSSLTASQLSQITFDGFGAGAMILASGELVPSGVPEPSTYIISILLTFLCGFHIYRKRK